MNLMPLFTYQHIFLSGDKQTLMIKDMGLWTTTSIKCLAGPPPPARRYLSFSQTLDDGCNRFA